MFDIDHFKRVNDTYGHPTGAAVLRNIAAIVSPQLRSSDILARYGGEEFIVVLPHCDEAGAAVVAEKIRAAIENDALEASTGALKVTVSVGGCVSTD